ncbi:hypothetical protein LRB11_07180 [Ectothiorhodospira haloalkaliphila]|nr:MULTISPECIES: hypothetical protein [Ectothiorhodospira]MCG5493881.1 hypothetical protein [Ectothiorhodospira variabilis]MCG5498095.1 hypothetical protein [Ectothiorhodospira variabilis]MCG5506840.1 hypothetical protein [Ectothiorhodospira variabilis]MCG5524712.1 hypothetical protein [Ectothiorhodospira haloalkaliphila]
MMKTLTLSRLPSPDNPALILLPWLAALAAVIAALTLGDPAAHLAGETDTSGLLRGFAMLKGVITLVALLLLSWRLLWPVPRFLLVGYVLAIVSMAGAAAMVWQLSYLGLVSIFFHGGLILLLLMAWKDSSAH